MTKGPARDAFCFIATMMLCSLALAAPKKAPIPAEIMSAKSIYIVNETGNQAVLDAAHDEFTKWGRFAIANSKNNADLVVVFTHKYGMDKWGNVAFIVMDVFPKGGSKPVFEAKNAAKLIFEPQRRTRRCIADFEKRLERKP